MWVYFPQLFFVFHLIAAFSTSLLERNRDGYFWRIYLTNIKVNSFRKFVEHLKKEYPGASENKRPFQHSPPLG